MNINQFLTPLNQGAGMHDYAHGLAVFRPDSFRLHPKYAFLYYVRITVDGSTPGGASGISLFDNVREIGALAKTASLPKFSLSVKNLNAYNRVNLVNTKIAYDPVTIKFHDDSADLMRKFWYDYYSYYYRDSDYQDITYQVPHKYNPRATDQWGYGLRQDKGDSTNQLITKIEIFSFHQKQFSSVTLHKPMITSFRHGEHDFANGTGLLEHEMTVQYETVTYQSGNVVDAQFGGDMLIAYDNRPSPITPVPPPNYQFNTNATEQQQADQQAEVQAYSGNYSYGPADGNGGGETTAVQNNNEVGTEDYKTDPNAAKSPYASQVAFQNQNKGTDATMQNGEMTPASNETTSYNQAYSGNYSYGTGAAGQGQVVDGKYVTPQTPTQISQIPSGPVSDTSRLTKAATGILTGIAQQVIRGRNVKGKISAPYVGGLLQQAGVLAGGQLGAKLQAAGGLVKAGAAIARGGIGPGNLGTAVVAIKAASTILGKQPSDFLPFGKINRASSNGSPVGIPGSYSPGNGYAGTTGGTNIAGEAAKWQAYSDATAQKNLPPANPAEVKAYSGNYSYGNPSYSSGPATINDSADITPPADQGFA